MRRNPWPEPAPFALWFGLIGLLILLALVLLPTGCAPKRPVVDCRIMERDFGGRYLRVCDPCGTCWCQPFVETPVRSCEQLCHDPFRELRGDALKRCVERCESIDPLLDMCERVCGSNFPHEEDYTACVRMCSYARWANDQA